MKTQEKPLMFPLTAFKNLDRGPAPGRHISSQINVVYYELGVTGTHLARPSWSTSSLWPSKYLFTKYWLFHLHVNWFPLLGSPKSQPSLLPYPYLNYPIFLWSPCMYIHKKFGYFPLLTSFISIWLLAQPEELRRIKRKSFSSPTPDLLALTHLPGRTRLRSSFSVVHGSSLCSNLERTSGLLTWYPDHRKWGKIWLGSVKVGECCV